MHVSICYYKSFLKEWLYAWTERLVLFPRVLMCKNQSVHGRWGLDRRNPPWWPCVLSRLHTVITLAGRCQHGLGPKPGLFGFQDRSPAPEWRAGSRNLMSRWRSWIGIVVESPVCLSFLQCSVCPVLGLTACLSATVSLELEQRKLCSYPRVWVAHTEVICMQWISGFLRSRSSLFPSLYCCWHYAHVPLVFLVLKSLLHPHTYSL